MIMHEEKLVSLALKNICVDAVFQVEPCRTPSGGDPSGKCPTFASKINKTYQGPS